jgi:regulator of sirC expression with transglutaminase-like and TPR domain
MPESLQFPAPTPLEYFSALVAEDASLSLLEAAAAIAQDDYPDVDVQAVLDEVDALASRLKRRIPADAPELHRLRLLNQFFFAELGFAGNVNDYHDPDNSYLHRVLATRRGIPITLAVLYLELATQVGLKARGVCFPGHFLVKLRMRAGAQYGEVVIDPFTGRSLAREELNDLVQPYRVSQGLTGDFEVPLGLFLQSAEPRDILARMLRNLKEIYRRHSDWERLLAVCDRLVVVLPAAVEERRDRAMVLAELGHFRQAQEDLRVYLQAMPGASDVAALESLMAAWPSGE